MDGIVQALQGVLTNAGGGANWGNILKAGAVGGGGGFDLFSDIKNLQQLNKVNSFLNNPAKAAQWIAGATQPLSQSLKQNVGNATQGYLGERGLATSPNIAASVESQALAPYELDNQKMATQAFLAMLNPQKYPQIDLGGLMKLLKPTPSIDGGGDNVYGAKSVPGGLLDWSSSDPSVGWNANTPTVDVFQSPTLDMGS